MEELLIQHCAPTLAGIKTGSLFTCIYESKAQVISNIRCWNRKLVTKGLRMLPLHYSENRVMIYLYRPLHLAVDLSDQEARAILKDIGYPDCSVEQCVRVLIRRLGVGEYFPHEIGLFLGFPPEDVRGFIENKACGYKCIGCWKVYGDANKAQKTFERYKRCKQSYCSQWSKGITVERLTVAV